MSKNIQRRRVSRIIAAVALSVPTLALASAKDTAVEKPASPEATVVPRARPIVPKRIPPGSLLHDVVSTLGRNLNQEASPFEPPGRPPDRPPDPPARAT